MPESETRNANPFDAAVPRRTLLVVAGASGLLVACGSGSDTSSPADASGSADSSPSTSGEVLAVAADVPVGGGTVNKDVHVVVTQPTAGDYRAFTSICTHQGCDVSTVADNVITCGCHGSQYSAETGDVERGPAPSPLAEITVVVDGESIVRA